MISLLFISSSPRADLLRVHFQQILKIRIEVVEDFDRGLKDVFEKRPLLVCIQEQIAGVTGESVARHIQLLLGTGAPGFILMHDGSTKAKVVPGLFKCLIDLTTPFEEVCKALQLALQTMLGEHWDKVYTPLPEPIQEPEPRLESVSAADQLVDDFIAENSIFNPHLAPPLPNHDTYTATETMFLEDLPGGPPAEPQSARVDTAEVVDRQAAVASVSGGAETIQFKPGKGGAAVKLVPEPQPLAQKTPERPVRQVQQPSAASSDLLAKKDLDESNVPVEELLHAFETNYQNSRRRRFRLVYLILVLLLAVAAVWWITQRRQTKPSVVPLKQLPVSTSLPHVAAQTVSSSARTAAMDQKVAKKSVGIPSFIPKAGQDHAFSHNKPGWSRYLRGNREYRLFQPEGRIIALQVLVVGDGSITVTELKQVLQELAGTEQYRTVKQEKKGRLVLERATVPKRAELLIYRTVVKGPIKAFVIELLP